VDREILREAARLGTATLYEAAGQKGALPSALKPLAPGMRIAGTAFPVSTPPGNNLWIHRALPVASPGEILVVATSEHHDAGYWGDVMTVAALSRGIGGLVIDGCVRDSESIIQQGFPVFARGVSLRGTKKEAGAGSVRMAVVLGDATVDFGDLVVGDADGVVVVPLSRVSDVLEKAQERDRREAEVMERLRNGETTLQIYGWK
jgi:4-hydroxy-4-methyl-2-oxoglutarate aldolase